MPATFELFGIKFLYPDNWREIERREDEGSDGVTLELPSGGFFSFEKDNETRVIEDIIEEVAGSLAEDYEEVEREELSLDEAIPNERNVDFRFYYLDLLIVSRLTIMRSGSLTLVLQMQAESRDFDQNELVFSAILKQIREAF